MITEQANPHSEQIDTLSPLEIVRIINSEDQTVAKAVEAVLPQVAKAVETITTRIEHGGRLIYIGAGTSGRLAVLDAAECVPTYSVPRELVQAVMAGGNTALTNSVEDSEDNRDAARADLAAINFNGKDTLVGIAASGSTPYVLEAILYAREKGAVTIGVSCNVPAPLLDSADIAIGVVPGSEVIAGSTRMKAGTAQKMVLNMLSTATMIRLGKVYGNLMVDVNVSNTKLLRRAQGLVAKIAHMDVERASQLLAQANNEVKTAVVMERKQVDATTARQLLAQVNGHLRRVIG